MGYVGVDAGGTSWKAVLTDRSGRIVKRTAVPTTAPQTTIDALCSWISDQKLDGHAVDAIGLSCFGPIDRNPGSDSYGKIGTTTKPGWQGVNPRTEIERITGLPCMLDYDVNGALLAETEWGAASGLADVVYVTVGTGVGGAALVNGNLVGSPYHGEFGHIQIGRSQHELETFAGSCPYHGDCVEGLASATAIRTRWGVEPHELADDHDAWDMVSKVLANMCLSITYLLAPQRIILGGGLLQRELLIVRIREEFEKRTNGFQSRPEPGNAESYLTLPKLRDDTGALGGVFLATRAKAKR